MVIRPATASVEDIVRTRILDVLERPVLVFFFRHFLMAGLVVASISLLFGRQTHTKKWRVVPKMKGGIKKLSKGSKSQVR